MSQNENTEDEQQKTEATLLPYQQRVVDEKAELDYRLGNLNTFLDTSTFNSMRSEERQRMIRQQKLMTELSEVLGERIAEF